MASIALKSVTRQEVRRVIPQYKRYSPAREQEIKTRIEAVQEAARILSEQGIADGAAVLLQITAKGYEQLKTIYRGEETAERRARRARYQREKYGFDY